MGLNNKFPVRGKGLRLISDNGSQPTSPPACGQGRAGTLKWAKIWPPWSGVITRLRLSCCLNKLKINKKFDLLIKLV